MKNTILLVFGLLLSIQFSFANLPGIHFPPGDSSEDAPDDWFNKDAMNDNLRGISTERAYNSILKGKKSKTVIVAILDSGVDIEHEDLKDVIWVNPGEVPGNGIDDDGNGYVDDIHGWNFIGGKDGKNVGHDSFELTREYKILSQKFEGKSESSLKGKEKKEYAYYKRVKADYNKKKSEAQMNSMGLARFGEMFSESKAAIKDQLSNKPLTIENVEAIEATSDEVTKAKAFLTNALANGLNEKELEKAKEYFGNQVEYYLNLDFDPRSIVGDNYENVSEKYYGNNDVEGPDPEHGTHVAGIVAAGRNNSIGMNGIADNVKIMSVRTVPDGDERDKDVANAIIYAVDNGAQVINMSFGKSYSPDKKAVDKAVKYAQKKGVLLIHAAGNDGKDIDEEFNYPTKSLKKAHSSKLAKNWLEIGASSWKNNQEFVANFSNFGQNSVDLFAPGVEIYSTTPNDTYERFPGTSMAAPMVSGVAALLFSYYPELDYKEVKEIILNSSVKYKAQGVAQPGSGESVSFGDLSVSGGLLNAYEAIKMAEARTK